MTELQGSTRTLHTWPTFTGRINEYLFKPLEVLYIKFLIVATCAKVTQCYPSLLCSYLFFSLSISVILGTYSNYCLYVVLIMDEIIYAERCVTLVILKSQNVSKKIWMPIYKLKSLKKIRTMMNCKKTFAGSRWCNIFFHD